MHIHTPARVLATTAAVGLAAGVTAAMADTSDHPGAEKVTVHGVGQIHLGDTHKSLRNRGLVGKLRKGCNLAGSGARGAKLKEPLAGSVQYTNKNPRKVRDILVTKGAAANGVGFGDSIKDIKSEFHRAKVDHSTDTTFGITLVRVPKRHSSKTRFEFGVSTKTKHVTMIGVPLIPFCE